MTIKDIYIGSDLKVHSPHQQGTLFPLDELCKGRTVVLKVFGRFGCPFTRYDAQLLRQQKEKLEDMGASLVGIGFDAEGVAAFYKKGFWNGEMYIDHEKCMYNFFQLPRLSKIQVIQSYMHTKTRNAFFDLKKKLGGNFIGDSLQTGGIFVINSKGRVIYACPQPAIGAITNVDHLIKVCQKEFIHRQKRPVPVLKTLKKPFQSPPAQETPAAGVLSDYFNNTSTTSLVSLASDPFPWN